MCMHESTHSWDGCHEYYGPASFHNTSLNSLENQITLVMQYVSSPLKRTSLQNQLIRVICLGIGLQCSLCMFLIPTIKKQIIIVVSLRIRLYWSMEKKTKKKQKSNSFGNRATLVCFWFIKKNKLKRIIRLEIRPYWFTGCHWRTGLRRLRCMFHLNISS